MRSILASLRAQMRADGRTPTTERMPACGPSGMGLYYRLTCSCGITGHAWSRDQSTLYISRPCTVTIKE